MSERLYLYPLWLRIWHGINAVLIILLIISGISMQYASEASPFIRFDLAVSMHNISGILLIISYAGFLAGNIATGNSRYYKIRLKGLNGRIRRQMQYYFNGMFKGQSPPYPVSRTRKFNPLQKISYVAVMYVLIPLVIITGLALLFPEYIISDVFGFSGVQLTALFHAFCGFLISVFLIIHIYVATIGTRPYSNFRSMISGYHESE